MVNGWQKLMSNVQELRARPSDTEKITVNLGYVDLGHVDLMVQEGFYSNRTDFIRTLEQHADVVKQTVARKTIDLGLRHYSREDLEAVEAARQSLHLRVLGLVAIAPDVSAELARATIASISLLGALHASAEVKNALADRMQQPPNLHQKVLLQQAGGPDPHHLNSTRTKEHRREQTAA
jgi:Arc/MetJ-type ribon-helix-helix transcriptional regulator